MEPCKAPGGETECLRGTFKEIEQGVELVLKHGMELNGEAFDV